MSLHFKIVTENVRFLLFFIDMYLRGIEVTVKFADFPTLTVNILSVIWVTRILNIVCVIR